MASNSVYFMKFKTDEDYSVDYIVDKLLDSEDEDKFIVNEVTDSAIEGYYITYINSKELVFDNENKLLESIILKKNLIIPFFIDISKQILDIWGKRNYISKFVNQISILLDNKVEIDPLMINLENIVCNIDESKVKIRNIKIDDYKIEENIIANCTFDLRSHSNPVGVVKKYSNNLVHITLTVLIGQEESFTMMIYKSGSIVIYQYREQLSQEDLDIIREICII